MRVCASRRRNSRNAAVTTRDNESEAWGTVFLVVGLFAVGQAVQVKLGGFHPRAIDWLTAAVLACSCAALHASWARAKKLVEATLPLLAGIALALQAAQLITTMPGNIGNPSPAIMAPYLRAVTFAAVVGGAALCDRSRFGKLLPVLLVALYLFIGRWMIHVQPNPFIDVYVFQRDGAKALLAGQNPYALRFPDIYGGKSPFYGPGLSINGQLQFGFPYPPLSLLLSALGQVLGGDPRYAHIACVGLAGLLIAYARPGRVANAALALLLFTPRTIFVIEQSWTEPFAILGLAASVFAALRAPKATPYLLGAFFVTKQYLLLALPLTWLLLAQVPGWREKGKWVLKALVVGLALTLPLALWDPSEFWHSVFALQTYQPFRNDALSYLAWWVYLGYPPQSALWGFAAALGAMALALWRLPRTAYGFAVGISITFLVFFAFNKQAFCNYYYFVMGALAVALAAGASPSQAPSPQRSPA